MKNFTGQDDIFRWSGKIGFLLSQEIIWEITELGRWRLLYNGPVLSRIQMEFSGQKFILDHEIFLEIMRLYDDKKVWD